MSQARINERLMVGVIASLAAGAFLWWVQSRFRTFPISALVDPEAVAGLASSFPQDEEGFTLAAWNHVGQHVAYSAYGSEMAFMDHSIRCQACLLPLETLRRGMGNCVSKSALLASLLRNRFPSESVYMAIGQVSGNGLGGHAWVELWRDGEWRVLEATRSPTAGARVNISTYYPEVLFNDMEVRCASLGRCISVSGCPCALLGV